MEFLALARHKVYYFLYSFLFQIISATIKFILEINKFLTFWRYGKYKLEKEEAILSKVLTSP